MNKLFIGIDVSKNDLDVAYCQNDKTFFLGKYPNNQNISFLQKQIEILDKAIKEHFDKHRYLKEQNKTLKTSLGVGNKTSPYLLVAVHRFSVLTDGKGTSKEITAYYGLAPKPHESGKSVHKRRRISRQGDRDIMHLLYMCALGGIRGNNPLRAFYLRLVGKGKSPKLAILAAARKIIVWCWQIFSQGLPFDVARFRDTC